VLDRDRRDIYEDVIHVLAKREKVSDPSNHRTKHAKLPFRTVIQVHTPIPLFVVICFRYSLIRLFLRKRIGVRFEDAPCKY
jgi:hypothetical protein